VFGEANGVSIIQTAHGQLSAPQWVAGEIDSPSLTTVSSDPFFHEDNYGTVWMIPCNGTFSYYDTTTQRLKQQVLVADTYGYSSLMNIKLGHADAQKNLWLTSYRDLMHVEFGMRRFHFYGIERNKEVRSAAFLDNGHIVIGTTDGKIVEAIKNDPTLYPVAGIPQDLKYYAIYEDSRHRRYFGTKGNGLYIQTPDGQMKHYMPDASNPYSINSENVYDIDEDAHGHIWIATYGGGVNLMDESQGGEPRFINNKNELKNYPSDLCFNVRRITHTAKDEILASTTKGLLTFSCQFNKPQNIRFFRTIHVASDTTSLLAGDVMQTLVTKKGKVYVATLGGGLQQVASSNLLADNLKLTQISMPSFLGFVLSLVEDHKGLVWAVHENALCSINPETGEQTPYSANALGKDTEFTEAEPSVNPRTGEIILPAMGGFVLFHPQDAKKSDFKPHIIFSYMRQLGSTTRKPILNAKRLTIPKDDRDFIIHFAALDYRKNDLVQYAYKLEGEDKDWVYMGKYNAVSFKNFPHGKHTLLVRSTNSDGIWMDNTARLEIYAEPTFSETIWAKLIVLILVLAILAGILYTLMLRQRAKMEQKMNELKTEFYTRIGHKLRTPLTLIGGPVDHVLSSEKLTDVGKKSLEMVSRNAQNMLHLVNQMLTRGNEDVYIDDENVSNIGAQPTSDHENTPQTVADTTTPTVSTATDEGEKAGNRVTILVVEDNADLRNYLKTILLINYNVVVAENGKIGLQKAKSLMPDFIISDVMMPEMDGLTMVRHIKRDNDICHIPIIILSAKASLDDRLQGLREGIDDYITKPFSATYLKQRVENIIAGRKLLQQNWLSQMKPEDKQTWSIEGPHVEDADSQMMQQLMTFLGDHIGDSNLKVEDLAVAVNHGRSVFYGKIKTITGMSPSDFLRHVRMQHAEKLLTESSLSLAEVAYAVGFADPKYFSRCFKKETGMTPTDYREERER